MNAVKPECSTGDVDMTSLRECHKHALVAKAHVFKAQDQAQRLGGDPRRDKLRDRAQALLWRARGALEELDNLLVDAQRRGP